MRRDLPRRRFRGRDFAAVSAAARRALGDDVFVLGTTTVRDGGAPQVELVAAAADDVARFEARITPKAFPSPVVPNTVRDRAVRSELGPNSAIPRSARDDGRGKAVTVALVGPTGAGKTTTAIKLAVHADAFAGKKVGFVTLDTYRAGAVAQLESYASVAGIPMEVVYDTHDVADAMTRLADRDVIVVDTPGRGPKAGGDAEWRALLDAIAPDETHLVIPATLRGDVADAVRDAVPGATHALLTKLDEVPNGAGVADLAARLDLPVRWVADGQNVPTDLAVGVPRLVQALAAGPESWS